MMINHEGLKHPPNRQPLEGLRSFGTTTLQHRLCLCRRSRADMEPRPIAFESKYSILDVPYALTHDLLTLWEHDSQDSKLSMKST